METIKVKLADGTEVEVPVENLPETIPGFVSESDLANKYVLKTVHNREFASLRKQSEGMVNPDEILDDDEFRKNAMAAWGIDPDGQAAESAERMKEAVAAEVNRQRQQWERRELQPVITERDSLQTRTATLMKKDRARAILEAANDAGVKEQWRKRNALTGTAPIVAMLESNFDFDEESGGWYLRGEDGQFVIGAKGGYKTPTEFFEDWGNDENVRNEFFEDARQRGPGTPGGNPPGGNRPAGKRGGVMELDYTKTKNAQEYRAAKEQAEEQGMTIKIVGRPGEE